jgi:hypothetical protein
MPGMQQIILGLYIFARQRSDLSSLRQSFTPSEIMDDASTKRSVEEGSKMAAFFARQDPSEEII